MRICSVEGCDRKHEARSYCEMHYSRIRINNTLEVQRVRVSPKKTIKDRFNDSYIPVTETGCWIWTGALNRHRGYGRLRFKDKEIKAHRYSWELHNGPIPDGLQVLHKCDTPACVNPDHLWLGTHKENMHDCIKKGRFVFNTNGRRKTKEE